MYMIVILYVIHGHAIVIYTLFVYFLPDSYSCSG
jgi:hypothetical protein